MPDPKEKATELEWLRWFWEYSDFGPADGDVRDAYRQMFRNRTGKEIPDGYRDDEE